MSMAQILIVRVLWRLLRLQILPHSTSFRVWIPASEQVHSSWHQTLLTVMRWTKWERLGLDKRLDCGIRATSTTCWPLLARMTWSSHTICQSSQQLQILFIITSSSRLVTGFWVPRGIRQPAKQPHCIMVILMTCYGVYQRKTANTLLLARVERFFISAIHTSTLQRLATWRIRSLRWWSQITYWVASRLVSQPQDVTSLICSKVLVKVS